MVWVVLFVTAPLTVLTLVMAVRSWRTSVAALHATYRPVLRPVPMFVKATGFMAPAELVLKNIGRGPALSVMVFAEKDETTVMAGADLVEPLGAPLVSGDDRTRIGRVRLEFDQGEWLEEGNTYRVVYQDIAANWHETQVMIATSKEIRVRYLGPKYWWQPWRSVPRGATARAQVIHATEFV